MTDDVLSDLSLSDVLAAAAEELAGVSVVSVGDVTSWSVAATPFATLTEGLAEFCLDSLVAAAAMRTPDTSASSRGPDWVAFGPSLLDDAAIDRAEAWFLSAHRRLTAGRRATRLD